MTEPNTDDAGPLLTPADLANFATIPTAKAAAMIEDALAMAAVVAPCITAGGFAHRAAAKPSSGARYSAGTKPAAAPSSRSRR